MLLTVKNKYLSEFLDYFPDDKRPSALKYLAIIGMDYVNTFYNSEENLLGKLRHISSKINIKEDK